MRLYLDIDTREFLQSPSFPRALTILALKRRDTDLIELQFLRDRTVQELPAGTTIRLGLKPSAAYTAEFLATGTFTKSGTGISTKYLLDLNLNTVALNAAFSATPEPETLASMLEVEWASGTTISSSLTLPVSILNDVIRGDEGTPVEAPLFYIASTEDFRATQADAVAGTDNDKWMTPLRTKQAITELAADAAPVQSVAGRTGTVTLAVADVDNAVATSDARLSDSRTPSSTLAHASSHALGGSDPLSPSAINAQSIFTLENLALTSTTRVDLTAARAKIFAVLQYADGTARVRLPQTDSQAGDVFVFRFATGSGSFIVESSTAPNLPLATLSSGQQLRFIKNTSGGWDPVPVDTHTHAISDTTGLQTALDDKQASGSYAAATHAHGNLTNAGAIGDTSGVPVITGTGGVLQAGSFGTAAGTFCQGNDARLLTLTGGITAIAIVDELPEEPDASTLYIVT
jgi:hypothetical protein